MNWSTLHLKPHVGWIWAVVGGGRDTPLRAAAGEGRWGLTPVCFCCTGFWHGYCRVHTIPIETNADLSNTPPLIDSSPSAGLHLSNITRLWHFPRCQPTSALKKACILKISREKHMHLSADCFNTFFPSRRKSTTISCDSKPGLV